MHFVLHTALCVLPMSLQEKKQREELEARVKLLAELDEKYEDLGAC